MLDRSAGFHQVGEATAPAVPAGLVSHPTSDTLELSRDVLRLKRMRRGVLATGVVLQESHASHRAAMVTLTYAPGQVWAPLQISAFLKRVREWARRRRRKLSGVWVLELQQRGAPHYHVVLWLPRGVTLPKPDKRGWWPHGSTRIEWARRPVGYLAKYTSKGETGELPGGARIWGAFGRTVAELSAIRWRRAPQWLLEVFGGIERDIRKLGAWWRADGWEYRSPWRLAFWTTEKVTLVNIGAVECRPVVC